MPKNRPVKASAKPEARSRVGNGYALLPDVDHRSVAMRRYKEIYGQFVSDLGGDPSEAQHQLARRATQLSVWCELREAEAANGQDLDIATYTTATNALRRFLSDLGLERRMQDVTPTIAGYIAQRAAAKKDAT